MNQPDLMNFSRRGVELLQQEDPTLFQLMTAEYQRQANVLTLVASSSIAHPSTLACASLTATNVTAEGYPGARFHAGCAVVDQIEALAIERAKAIFSARYANVQPHSATTANEIVMFSMLQPGDTILGLKLSSGGHLTHGASVSISGRCFNAVGYGLDRSGLIDFDQVRRKALAHKPKMIICGTTAYPRRIDFARFRQIADEVGAFLLADITHIAGLIVAGEHPNSIDHAHFTTTCTHKQMFGPRGGLILIGKDYNCRAPGGKDSLAKLMQKGVFPLFQGAPPMNAIAAKACAFANVATPQFRQVFREIVGNARALAQALIDRGFKLVTGGTDNHIVLVDVLASTGITGSVAEKALEECGIVVNKNKIPGDRKSATVTSGIRLGTNGIAFRGLGPREMETCADLIHRTLNGITVISQTEFHLDPHVRESVTTGVGRLCGLFPIPHYPLTRKEETIGASLFQN